jgi:hypothetical protein
MNKEKENEKKMHARKSSGQNKNLPHSLKQLYEKKPYFN